MKFGRPLAIIVHYTVQFNLECCKSSVLGMGPNTLFLNQSNIGSGCVEAPYKQSE